MSVTTTQTKTSKGNGKGNGTNGHTHFSVSAIRAANRRSDLDGEIGVVVNLHTTNTHAALQQLRNAARSKENAEKLKEAEIDLCYAQHPTYARGRYALNSKAAAPDPEKVRKEMQSSFASRKPMTVAQKRAQIEQCYVGKEAAELSDRLFQIIPLAGILAESTCSSQPEKQSRRDRRHTAREERLSNPNALLHMIDAENRPKQKAALQSRLDTLETQHTQRTNLLVRARVVSPSKSLPERKKPALEDPKLAHLRSELVRLVSRLESDAREIQAFWRTTKLPQEEVFYLCNSVSRIAARIRHPAIIEGKSEVEIFVSSVEAVIRRSESFDDFLSQGKSPQGCKQIPFWKDALKIKSKQQTRDQMVNSVHLVPMSKTRLKTIILACERLLEAVNEKPATSTSSTTSVAVPVTHQWYMNGGEPKHGAIDESMPSGTERLARRPTTCKTQPSAKSSAHKPEAPKLRATPFHVELVTSNSPLATAGFPTTCFLTRRN